MVVHFVLRRRCVCDLYYVRDEKRPWTRRQRPGTPSARVTQSTIKRKQTGENVLELHCCAVGSEVNRPAFDFQHVVGYELNLFHVPLVEPTTVLREQPFSSDSSERPTAKKTRSNHDRSTHRCRRKRIFQDKEVLFTIHTGKRATAGHGNHRSLTRPA